MMAASPRKPAQRQSEARDGPLLYPGSSPPPTDPPLGALTGTAGVPEVPCPDLRCRPCGEPRLLDVASG